MKLKIKILNWSAGIPVVMLNIKTAEQIGVHPQDRVLIKSLSSFKKMATIVDIVSSGLVKKNQIAISSEIKDYLNLSAGQSVDVEIITNPQSLVFIKEKLNGGKFSSRNLKVIIDDIVNNTLSEAEIALFVSAMYKQGMDKKETIFLINSILDSGEKLSFKRGIVADKHSIGGIAGNRTTPIVVSICASAGIIMPKTSSRAITSPAGTADVIETIAKVDFNINQLKKIIAKTGACLAWSGLIGIAPADSKILQVEKKLGIDPRAQLLASIMSKKLGSGAKYILIDIPYGKTAKVSKKQALELKKKFEWLGKYYRKKMRVVLTDGSQPMGCGVGPALELSDVIKVLNPSKTGPLDLENKSILLAGQILEMTGKAKKGAGEIMAKKILYSGEAFRKFREIIKAQGGEIRDIKPAKFKANIRAKFSGKIKEIDNKKINQLAIIAGCPADKFAGLYIYYNLGEHIKKGETILTIYSETKERLKQALSFCKRQNPVKLR